METKLTKKQYKNIIIASLTLLLHTLPYIASLFYVQFQEYYALSNTQIGFLLSCFGFVTIIGYFCGGMIADRFSAKNLMVYGTFLAGVLAIVMAFVKSFPVLCVIQLGFGIAAAVMQWSAFLKYIRFSGTDAQQGKLYSMFEITAAVMGIFTGYVVLAFMNKILASFGFGFVVAAYGALTIIFGILVAVFLDKPDYELNMQESSGSGFKFSQLGEALKMPITWFNAIMLVGLYLIYAITITYTSPVLQGVYGMSATLVVGILMFARYGLRIFLTPFGGRVIDKHGSSEKVLMWSAILIAVTLVVMILIPQSVSFAILFMVACILLCCFGTFVRPAYYTPVPEAKTPAHITGTVIGIVSAVGYSIDLWAYTVCGKWIDTHGAAGYRYVWAMCAIAAVIVAITAVFYGRYIKKIKGSV